MVIEFKRVSIMVVLVCRDELIFMRFVTKSTEIRRKCLTLRSIFSQILGDIAYRLLYYSCLDNFYFKRNPTLIESTVTLATAVLRLSWWYAGWLLLSYRYGNPKEA